MKPVFPFVHVVLGGLLLSGVSVLMVPPVSAQDENSKTVTASAPGVSKVALTAGEVRFVKEAGGGNLAEAKLGELAQNKGTDPDVKTFGQTMVADHTKANADLSAVAGKKGMPFEPKINTKNEALYERLSKLSGAAFDKAYVDAMAKDHMQDAAEYEAIIQEGKDDDLKKYATDTLPVIQHHLQMVKAIKDKADGKK